MHNVTGILAMRRLALLIMLAIPLGALAARPDNLQPLPDAPAPQNYGPNEPALEPQITIVQKDSATFQEYRVRGRLYQIKIVPRVGPAYYLVDDKGDGIWRRYDGQDNDLRVPRWVILEF